MNEAKIAAHMALVDRCFDAHISLCNESYLEHLRKEVESSARALAAPQASPAKPLSDEHIERLWGEFMSARGSGYVPDFVRSIEAAHGIGITKGATP